MKMNEQKKVNNPTLKEIISMVNKVVSTSNEKKDPQEISVLKNNAFDLVANISTEGIEAYRDILKKALELVSCALDDNQKGNRLSRPLKKLLEHYPRFVPKDNDNILDEIINFSASSVSINDSLLSLTQMVNPQNVTLAMLTARLTNI